MPSGRISADSATGRTPAEEAAGHEAADGAPARRRPWWWRLGALLIEGALVVGVAWAVPHALAWALRTECPLATITSSSMWPALKRGDLVVVRGLDGAGVGVGDIVVYRNATDATMVIHRVVETNGATLVTRGDANSQPDEPISLADVVGVVPTVGDAPLRVPYLGQITLLANGGI